MLPIVGCRIRLGAEHRSALDRMGVLSELDVAEPGTPTVGSARRRAVERIKTSIDRGAGVILWGVGTGEFGIVYGHDDDDGVILVSGIGGDETGASDPILYEDVGLTFEGAPILFCQTPVEAVPFDRDRTYRQSLAFYAEQMDKGDNLSPAYHSGLRAYDAWMRAMDSGRFNPFGLRYIAAVYADAKANMAEYLGFLAENWDASAALLGFAVLLASVSLIATSTWALFGSAIQRLLGKYRRPVNTGMALLLLYAAVSVSGIIPRIQALMSSLTLTT